MSTIQISDIQLFNALKSKLGDNEAEQLVPVVPDVSEAHQEQPIKLRL